MSEKGFTLIELLVVVAIIVVLSGIILFSVTQYIARSKDSNISANLAVLIPAGEIYYNANNASLGTGYAGFCDLSNSVITNAIKQMPVNSSSASCYNGTTNPAALCCGIAGANDAWAACVPEFASPDYAYCVDSRGVKMEIGINACTSSITICQ
jgi:prepilin-type N-terminal cleavage/methylation domain-containing protein